MDPKTRRNRLGYTDFSAKRAKGHAAACIRGNNNCLPADRLDMHSQFMMACYTAAWARIRPLVLP